MKLSATQSPNRQSKPGPFAFIFAFMGPSNHNLTRNTPTSSKEPSTPSTPPHQSSSQVSQPSTSSLLLNTTPVTPQPSVASRAESIPPPERAQIPPPSTLQRDKSSEKKPQNLGGEPQPTGLLATLGHFLGKQAKNFMLGATDGTGIQNGLKTYRTETLKFLENDIPDSVGRSFENLGKELTLKNWRVWVSVVVLVSTLVGAVALTSSGISNLIRYYTKKQIYYLQDQGIITQEGRGRSLLSQLFMRKEPAHSVILFKHNQQFQKQLENYINLITNKQGTLTVICGENPTRLSKMIATDAGIPFLVVQCESIMEIKHPVKSLSNLFIWARKNKALLILTGTEGLLTGKMPSNPKYIAIFNAFQRLVFDSLESQNILISISEAKTLNSSFSQNSCKLSAFLEIPKARMDNVIF